MKLTFVVNVYDPAVPGSPPLATASVTADAPVDTPPPPLPPPPPPPPSPGGGFVLAEGDSITANPGSYARLYAAANPGVTVVNTAVIGNVLADVINRRPADIAQIAANPGKGAYIYTLLIGANEGGAIAADVNGYVAKLAAHLDAVRAGGFTRIVIQTTTSGGIAEPARSQYDAALMALVPAHADAMVNYRNTIVGWDGSNNLIPSYFDSPLHPSAGGNAAMKPLYEQVVNSLLAGNIPTPIPNPGPPAYPLPRPNTLDELTASPGPQLTFSNNNCTVANNDATGAGGLVRTMIGKASGKWYAEFRVDSAGHQIFGFCDDGNFKAGFPVCSNLGEQPFELGLIPNSAGYSNFGTYGNTDGFSWVPSGSAGIDGLANADRIMFAWDADARVAWLGRNGNWGAGNDPSHGIGGMVTWPAPYTIFPVVQLRETPDTVTYIPSGQLYIPSGFSPLS